MSATEENYGDWWEREQEEAYREQVEPWLEHLEHEREQQTDRLWRDVPIRKKEQ